MKDFRRWLNESVLHAIQKATDILQGRNDKKDILDKIRLIDPYDDKRFAPVIARWVVELNVAPEEHANDIIVFKQLRRRLKDLRIPALNTERTRQVKDLLAVKPEDFRHYSALAIWNRIASGVLDPDKDLSDEGLPVVMRYNGYTMYRIDTKKHCKVPLVKNTMSWCVTNDSFGDYGGPPYYPIVRDDDREPFAIIIPGLFDKDPDQAVRNAQNDERLSPSDLAKIRPLAQHVLPMEKHKHPYIKGIYGIRPRLPEKLSPDTALDTIKNYAIKPGEWPEGESAIATDALASYEYARNIIRGRFLEGEPVIATDPDWSYWYAVHIGGRFLAGEQAIANSYEKSYMYAENVLEGPFPPGEAAIAKNPAYSFKYARHILKGRFSLGEPVMARINEFAYNYARFVLKGPFPLGEAAIAEKAETSYLYARFVLRGPFPLGEKQIRTHDIYKTKYAVEVLNDPGWAEDQ